MGENEAARPIFPGKNPKTQRDSQPDRLLVVATRVSKRFARGVSILFFYFCIISFQGFGHRLYHPPGMRVMLRGSGQHLPPGGP
jgi:hypothetical protein